MDDVSVDIWRDVWCIDGWLYGWMDGWMVGSMDVWMEGVFFLDVFWDFENIRNRGNHMFK